MRAAGIASALVALALVAPVAHASPSESLLTPLPARPEDEPGAAALTVREEPRRRLVVSVPVLSISSNAIAVQAEHPVARRLSVSLGVGIADGADGDYQALTGALGAELRLWLNDRQRGFFVAPRLETSATRTSVERMDRSIGTSLTFAEGVVIGWRFVILDHVEITPSVGWLAFHDVGTTEVPTQTRFPPIASLALGWVF